MTMTVESGADAAMLLDAADRLILDEAAGLLPGATVAVLGSAALGAAARERGAAVVRVSDDADAATESLTASLFDGASVVLLRLPKSLSALDGAARFIAASALPEIVVVAGGRLKYMTVGMNEVLLRSFGRLDVSLARQKSRVLVAREPLPVAETGATRRLDVDLDLWVTAVGGVFAGATVDIGTRAMLAAFDRLPPYGTAIDFGCGTGILAAELKRRHPGARVIASDVSAAAVESARGTAAANELDLEVVRDDGLSGQPDASVDLIVLNPPFHAGGAVSLDTAHAMFAEARRVLRPGGQLWSVWNSHLGYTGALVRTVGPTVQISRNAKFTVTASTRSSDRLGPTDPASE
jgi:16S rRNA (guanine1207-N2)-methyltransferase